MPKDSKPPKDVYMLMCMPSHANRSLIGAYGISKDPSTDF